MNNNVSNNIYFKCIYIQIFIIIIFLYISSKNNTWVGGYKWIHHE